MLREMGNKLANFRRKLDTALNEKKITQIVFGDMFGGHTSRKITSYERGEVDPPASLLYRIWKSGNSIDGIFAELPIEEKGVKGARELYKNSAFAKLRELDAGKIDKMLKEVQHDKSFQDGTTTETSAKTPGKSKAGAGQARRVKKR